MNVIVVQRLHELGYVRIAGGVKHIGTPWIGIPVHPVLHDIIYVNVRGAILVFYANQFRLAVVGILALPITPGPFSKHGHRAREITIICNHSVGLGAIHEIIINRRGRLRGPGHGGIGAKSDVGYGWIVPEYSMTK